MKKITEHLKAEWYKYFLEILVITIGILGAFALNSWNDSKLERQEEMAVLLRVKNDLQNTIDEFIFLNGIRDKVLAGTRGLLEVAASNEVDEAQIDSLLSLTFYRPTFNNKMGAIDLLFATGKLNIIQSDSIKSKLITWPGSVDDTIEEEAYAMKVFQDHYTPKLAEYVYVNNAVSKSLGISFFGGAIKGTDFPAIDIPNDYEGLLNDRAFLNHLRMRASHMQVSNSETVELVRQTKEIIRLIDKELAR